MRTERRLALVIGNSAYTCSPLRNASRDAESFARELRKSDPAFTVELVMDADIRAMDMAVDAFMAELKGYDIGLFYFSGHGFQFQGANYLTAVDTELRAPSDLRRQTLPLNDVLMGMRSRVLKSSIAFVDACRKNPFPPLETYFGALRHGGGDGLAEVRAAPGCFIGFSTSPDNTAVDGRGYLSPFTRGLIENMGIPDLSIHDLMIRVRREVLEETDGEQDPWEQSSLRHRFCFRVKAEPPDLSHLSPLMQKPPPLPLSCMTLRAREILDKVKARQDASGLAKPVYTFHRREASVALGAER